MNLNRLLRLNSGKLSLLVLGSQKNSKFPLILPKAVNQNYKCLTYSSEWNWFSTISPQFSQNRQFAEYFYTQNQLKDAAEYYLKSLDEEILTGKQNPDRILDLYEKIGECFERLEEYEVAMQNYQKAAEIIIN